MASQPLASSVRALRVSDVVLDRLSEDYCAQASGLEVMVSYLRNCLAGKAIHEFTRKMFLFVRFRVSSWIVFGLSSAEDES